MKGRRLHCAVARAVAVHHITIAGSDVGPCIELILSRELPGFSSPRSLLACRVLFGESLLDGLCHPVIISNSTTVFDDATAKLAKHRTGGDHRYLTRPVGIWQDLLVDQFLLLLRTGNDFEQRAIFVEQEIRIAVLELARALGGQHEQLLTSSGQGECPDFVLPTALEVSQRIHLLLALFVVLTGYKFIAFWLKYIASVVSNRWQCFDRGFWNCSRRRGLRWRRRRVATSRLGLRGLRQVG